MEESKNKFTSKKEEAFKSLPPELHQAYEQLVTEYQFHCIEKHGRAFVSYSILADLIMDGWRPTHRPFVKLDFARKGDYQITLLKDKEK
jgi:hypothetical protein